MTELTPREQTVLRLARGNGPQVFTAPYFHAVEHLVELKLVEVRREESTRLMVHALPHATCQACGWEGARQDIRSDQPCPSCGQDEVQFFYPAR